LTFRPRGILLFPMRTVRRVLVLLACGLAAPSAAKEAAMQLSSPAFSAHAEIPRRFTCQGGDHSPPLAWHDVPAGAKSLALIVDDPDAPDPAAPKTTWVHWVLYNIPISATGLGENAAAGELPAGALHGQNDWKRAGYGGPCPPVGRHRYFHKLFALDTVLPNLKTPTKAALEKAMHGHVLARAEWVGTYQKQ
jgi:Raf kinase inhibitor-like YbhB/YbcL family protein